MVRLESSRDHWVRMSSSYEQLQHFKQVVLMSYRATGLPKQVVLMSYRGFPKQVVV
jgi:hypothetical protein